jgi:hypothetical protein
VWNTADGDFDQQLPTFQLSDYQLLLLPLFAQFANLSHLQIFELQKNEIAGESGQYLG